MYAEGRSHSHFAALPGMFDRTVTLSSAGKTFSITGWQAGWCIGPERLVKPIQLLLPFVQFCVSTPIQNALSRVLSKANEPYEGHDSYYGWLTDMFRRKRSLLAAGLRRAGMEVMEGHGGCAPRGHLEPRWRLEPWRHARAVRAPRGPSRAPTPPARVPSQSF